MKGVQWIAPASWPDRDALDWEVIAANLGDDVYSLELRLFTSSPDSLDELLAAPDLGPWTLDRLKGSGLVEWTGSSYVPRTLVPRRHVLLSWLTGHLDRIGLFVEYSGRLVVMTTRIGLTLSGIEQLDFWIRDNKEGTE